MITPGRSKMGERPHEVSKLIETLAEELERPREVTQQVSDHIWGTYEIDRRNILSTYLTAAGRHNLYQSGDGIQLLQVAEYYKPTDLAHLMKRIQLRQETLQQEIDADNPKPFFSDQIKANHGFDRDQRPQDGGQIAAKKEELAFLDRLHQVLMG
jgi:hypothetical protein